MCAYGSICGCLLDSMAEGESYSDMFSQQQAQRLHRRRERAIETIDSKRMTSSKRSEHAEGERAIETTESNRTKNS